MRFWWLILIINLLPTGERDFHLLRPHSEEFLIVITSYSIHYTKLYDETERPMIVDDTAEKLTEQVAQEIYAAIRHGDGDFWEKVYVPYSESRISRDVVATVVAQARRDGASNMPKIAILLHACDPKSETDEARKLFYKFKIV